MPPKNPQGEYSNPNGGEWRNEEDLKQLCNEHERLIGLILEEEEEVINTHKQHIDDTVDLVKQEMLLLHEVDKPGSDVEEYIASLDAILLHKMDLIVSLRNKLGQFHQHLKQEEALSKKFYSQKDEVPPPE